MSIPVPGRAQCGAIPFLVLLAALIVPAAPAGAADGAWTSYLYPAFFADLVATDTEVWASTREGGLLRYDRATHAIERIVREPNGLASNDLTRMALDRSGRLWVGTLGSGVSRYRADRTGWDVVNRLDGLPTDSVTAVVAIGDTVWIGSTGGLLLWNGREVSGSLPDPNTTSFDTTFTNPIVTGIVQMGDSLWVATRTGIGLARLSRGLSDWREVNQGLSGVDIEDLAWNGTYLVAVGEGTMYQFQFGTGTWSFIPNNGAMSATSSNGTILVSNLAGVCPFAGLPLVPLPGSPQPFFKNTDSYRDYLRAVTAPDGAVFAGTGSFLYERTPMLDWLVHDVPSPIDNELIGLATDRGRVYAQSFDGFSRFDGTTWQRWPSNHPCVGAGCDTTFQDPSFGVSLFVDSQGAKWAGFWSYGFDRFTDDSHPYSFDHLIAGVSSDSAVKRTWTYSATEDTSGHVWIGMDTPLSDDPSNQPLGLTAYALDGSTYLGTWSTRNSEMRGLYVRGLAFDRFGRVWLGYKGQGVDFFQPNPRGSAAPVDSNDIHPLTAPEASNLFVRGIVTYGDTLWILSESDLQRYRLNPGLGTPATFLNSYSLPANQADLAVQPLAIQSDGSLWIGTTGGLVAIHPGASGSGYTSEVFTTANSPLVTNAVRSLAFDDRGRLWVATTQGLQQFDPGYTPPPPPSLPSLAIKVYPNPAYSTAIGVNLRLDATSGTSVQGAIYDIGGRRVRAFQTTGSNAVFWDGRDEKGNLVKPGIYFVRADAGDRQAFARIVLLH